MSELKHLIEGDEFIVRITTDPEDWSPLMNSIEDDGAQLERVWGFFEDELRAKHGAWVQTVSTELPYVGSDGSMVLERRYWVQSVLPNFDSESVLVGGGALFPFVTIAIIIAAAAVAWHAVDVAGVTLREPLKIVAEKVTPGQIDRALEVGDGISDALKTLAVALVVGLILAKVA